MSTFSMLKLFVRRSWMVLALLYIGFVVLTWCIPANAAKLKDIRVGEYNGFTRIVFELDEPAINPGIEIQFSNQLLVTFKTTDANLVRHIPVERSPHVDEIQFWQRKAALSTLLIFDYPHIRLEPFRLSRPPRFAVDVFPVAEPVQEKNTEIKAPAKMTITEDKNNDTKGISKRPPLINDTRSEPASELSAPSSEYSDEDAPPISSEATDAPLASKSLLDESDDTASTPEQSAPSPDGLDNRDPSEITTEKIQPSGPTQPMDEGKNASSEQDGPSPAQRASNDSSKADIEAVQSPMPPAPPSDPTIDIQQDADNPAQKTPPPGNRLQFYLVIILVIITIAILLLLLLMLLTRHQLFYDKDELSTAEISQHQDKNIIAQLDSNIKEQLKRYDEA